MKIAIASEGKDEDSMMSEKGGRAPYYLIFEDKKIIEVIKNPFAMGSGGAGFSVAYMMADKKVNLVIAGKLGKNMESALKEKGTNFREESKNKVKEIIDKTFD